MAEFRLDFEKILHYNAGEDGITVDVNLAFSDKSISFPAKIDTGSALCIFERKYGEQLGLEIESGLFKELARQPEFLRLTVFASCWKLRIFSLNH